MGRTELLREIEVPYTSIEVKGLYFPVTEVSSVTIDPPVTMSGS